MGAADHGGPRSQQPVAATRIVSGADVNYGALTRNLLDYLRKQDASPCISRRGDRPAAPAGGGWRSSHERGHRRDARIGARYVFLGAGGAAIRCCRSPASPRPRASPASR
jgi:malate dehydrogenase (quinone)